MIKNEEPCGDWIPSEMGNAFVEEKSWSSDFDNKHDNIKDYDLDVEPYLDLLDLHDNREHYIDDLKEIIQQKYEEIKDLEYSIKVVVKKNIELFQEIHKLKQQKPKIDNGLIKWLKSWNIDRFCQFFYRLYNKRKYN